MQDPRNLSPNGNSGISRFHSPFFIPLAPFLGLKSAAEHCFRLSKNFPYLGPITGTIGQVFFLQNTSISSRCQSALNIDLVSASKTDPPFSRYRERPEAIRVRETP